MRDLPGPASGHLSPDRSQMSVPELVELLAPEADAGIKQLVCLDDAIAYRLHLLAQPCADCQPAGQCPEHASYHGVIAGYRRWHATVLNELLAGFDPAEVRQEMSRGDGTPPTIVAIAMLIEARLKELTADGPVIAEDHQGVALIEGDGTHLHRYPLAGPA
jgi:hypothetical protein